MGNDKNCFFPDVWRELLVIEECKQELSKKILQVRDFSGRQKLIYSYLTYDLDKHELLEYTARMVINKNEELIIKQLDIFYCHVDGPDLLSRIQAELRRTRVFLNSIARAMEDYQSIPFVEKRLIKEINKYVLAQARLYGKISPLFR